MVVNGNAKVFFHLPAVQANLFGGPVQYVADIALYAKVLEKVQCLFDPAHRGKFKGQHHQNLVGLVQKGYGKCVKGARGVHYYEVVLLLQDFQDFFNVLGLYKLGVLRLRRGQQHVNARAVLVHVIVHQVLVQVSDVLHDIAYGFVKL